MNNSATPTPEGASAKDDANCAWSDYRKDYGVSADKAVRTLEHKAFHAGWDAAREAITEWNIVIPRRDLPKVEVSERGWLYASGVGMKLDQETPERSMKNALGHLAIVTHLESAQSAEAVAAEKLAKRRDELAREYWGELTLTKDERVTRYEQISSYAQRAIDRIIELEAAK